MGKAALGQRLSGVKLWVRFMSAACVLGLAPVIVALTVHDHGSSADPSCVRRCFTLVHAVGTGILGFVGAPLVLGLLVLALLALKGRGHRRAGAAAWSLALLMCCVCLFGLFTSVGMVMLPVAVLTMCAVVTAPSRQA